MNGLENIANKYKKIANGLAKIQLILGGIFLTVFLVVVLIQIFSRYLGIVAVWTEDLTKYAFIWSAFMGAGAMVNENAHFAFTSLADTFKGRGKVIINLVVAVIVLIFAALMVKYGVDVSRQFWNYKWISIPSFIMGPVWMSLPVAGASMVVYQIGHILTYIVDFAKGGTK